MIENISIIGIGFVGNAIKNSFELKSKELNLNLNIFIYDKFKSNDLNKSNSLQECLNGEIIFLCLPTLFNTELNEYDKSAIYDTCEYLNNNNYKGLIIIKSTVEPNTTNNINKLYPKLKLVHNPEFLSSNTAFEDFHNQKHIVLGISDISNTSDIPNVLDIHNTLDISNTYMSDVSNIYQFYKTFYPKAEISICKSIESESMKLFCNSFYSVKIQFFNELYLTCKSNGSNYNIIKDLMIKNGWINNQHTDVPGPDGELSYGGYCFPKDTNALLQYMKRNNVPSGVLDATINERNKMRN